MRDRFPVDMFPPPPISVHTSHEAGHEVDAGDDAE